MRIDESICPLLTAAAHDLAEQDGNRVLQTLPCAPNRCMMAVPVPGGYHCGLALGQYASNRIDMQEVPDAVQ